mmetsp:Transcript_57217/g.149005  ORF Transcript_57217/g.149005 Transcript_57217/m.149005 type:complete len:202 (-) Transcript_57217:135-740(-)
MDRSKLKSQTHDYHARTDRGHRAYAGVPRPVLPDSRSPCELCCRSRRQQQRCRLGMRRGPQPPKQRSRPWRGRRAQTAVDGEARAQELHEEVHPGGLWHRRRKAQQCCRVGCGGEDHGLGGPNPEPRRLVGGCSEKAGHNQPPPCRPRRSGDEDHHSPLRGRPPTAVVHLSRTGPCRALVESVGIFISRKLGAQRVWGEGV